MIYKFDYIYLLLLSVFKGTVINNKQLLTFLLENLKTSCCKKMKRFVMLLRRALMHPIQNDGYMTEVQINLFRQLVIGFILLNIFYFVDNPLEYDMKQPSHIAVNLFNIFFCILIKSDVKVPARIKKAKTLHYHNLCPTFFVSGKPNDAP